MALKCQVCDNDGVCKDDTDNGVETDCAPEEICGYYHAGNVLRITTFENISFTRVDSDSLDKLIKKSEDIPSKLSKEEIKLVESGCTSVIAYNNFEKRIRSLLYEIEFAKKNTNVNNQTMNQRLVFWQVGKEILLSKSFFVILRNLTISLFQALFLFY